MYNNVKTQDNDDLSMDEILASIRRYVADEQQHSNQPEVENTNTSFAPQNEPVSTMDSPHLGPSPSPFSNQPNSPHVIHLTPKHEVKDDKLYNTLNHNEQKSKNTDDVLSSNTIEKTSQSIHLLKEKTKNHSKPSETSSSQSVEGFIVTLMKPLIKRWLDDNLPGLVERMVQKEIQKITNNID